MNKKRETRLKRHRRIRMRMQGVTEKPRLIFHRSLNNLSATVVDDTQNKVLFSFSTLNKEIKEKMPSFGNIKAAQFFGEVFAQKAKEKGISKIVFDRAGYLYHGRVKAFAEALRKQGLEF
ncbi:MAG: 50S ribosomal protein L18 [Candidatus Omnitrophica bacterium]|nr:50S ribosomal protein L18 [Candidatus Omnitrophota bacterium]MDD5238723.1 50S ribosomal protein L18 [Candidatus Omnitrophota bacterium]